MLKSILCNRMPKEGLDAPKEALDAPKVALDESAVIRSIRAVCVPTFNSQFSIFNF